MLDRRLIDNQSSHKSPKTHAIPAIVRDECSPVPFAPMFKIVLMSGIGPDRFKGRGRYRRHLNDRFSGGLDR